MAAIALLLLLAVRAYQQRDLARGAAPGLAGRTLDGAPVSLADYRGAPVLLRFWATWCGVCKAEQSNVDAVARGLPVLSVASQSGSANQVAAYVRSQRIAHRVIADPEGVLRAASGCARPDDARDRCERRDSVCGGRLLDRARSARAHVASRALGSSRSGVDLLDPWMARAVARQAPWPVMPSEASRS